MHCWHGYTSIVLCGREEVMAVIRPKAGYFRPHIVFKVYRGHTRMVISYRRRMGRQVRNHTYTWRPLECKWDHVERERMYKYVMDDYGTLQDVTGQFVDATLWRIRHILTPRGSVQS
jgi:hypothetical protein